MADIPALMRASRGGEIMLRMRDGRSIRGMLREFDVMSMNLTLDGARVEGGAPLGTVLIRGDNIVAVSLPDAPAGGAHKDGRKAQ